MTNYHKRYNKYKARYFNLKNNKIVYKSEGGSKNKEIYLVRHGETDWNKIRRAQGQEADIPLNNKGKNQSERTGEYFKKFRIKGEPFDCIYSSPLKRAAETAKIIGDKINYEKEIVYDDLLMEAKRGKMSGKTYEDDEAKMLKKEKDVVRKKFIREPIDNYIIDIEELASNNLSFGMEPLREIKKRAGAFIEKIKLSDCKKIIIITHSSLMGEIIKEMFKLPIMPRGNMKIARNCSISYIVYKDEQFEMISPPNTEHFYFV